MQIKLIPIHAFIFLVRYSAAAVETDSDGQTNNFTINERNKTCLLWTSKIMLNIPIFGANQNGSKNVSVPTTKQYTGSCDEHKWAITLNITFNSTWAIVLRLKNHTGNALALDFIDVQLPQTTERGRELVHTAFNDSTETLCKGDSIFHLNKSLEIYITSLQLQAFGITLFSTTDPENCLQSSTLAPDTDVKFAIFIGIGLMVMIVVVLILYFIAWKLANQRG